MHCPGLFCRLEIAQRSELAGNGVDLLLLAERGQIPLIHGLGKMERQCAILLFCPFIWFNIQYFTIL